MAFDAEHARLWTIGRFRALQHRAFPIALGLIVLLPPVMVVFQDRDLRDLMVSMMTASDTETIFSQIGRFVTLIILGLSVIAVLPELSLRTRSASRARSRKQRRKSDHKFDRKSGQTARSTLDTRPPEPVRHELDVARPDMLIAAPAEPPPAHRPVLLKRRSKPRAALTFFRSDSLSVTLLAALLIYMTGNIVMPALFGAIPHFQLHFAYLFIVMIGAYASRHYPPSRTLDVAKLCLMLMLVAGLIAAVLRPDLALDYGAQEKRIDAIDFRLWGLGSGPNSVGPLAVLLLILLVHKPFRLKLLTLIAVASAAITLVLSQSQTAWTAAAVILPLMLIYRNLAQWLDTGLRRRPLLLLIGAPLVLFLIGLTGWELIHADVFGALTEALSMRTTDGDGGAGMLGGGQLLLEDQVMTGRGRIWALALDLWRDNFWFGYGLSAWDIEFRRMIRMPTAWHAHNQPIQALSVAGMVGLIALLIYLAVLGWQAFRTMRRSGGLTMALLVLVLIRSLTESPLESTGLLNGDALQHIVLFYAIASYGAALKVSSRRRSSSRRRRSASAIQPNLVSATT